MKSMTKENKSIWTAFPLFLVLFIDGMGLGIIFPILNSIIIDPASTFLPDPTSLHLRNFLYGLTIGIFMLCWFFGAAFLGDLSDLIGRKKTLMVCLIGAFIGYLLSAVGMVSSSLTVLIIGRMISGFTSGSQPIAQAAIVDLSSPEHKARNIGFVLFAVSLGFILGPMLGGVLSDSRIVHWFRFSTPFYFASLISFLNALLLWGLFRETFVPTRKVELKVHRAVDIFISAFRKKEIRNLSVIFLIMMIGWSSYYTYIPMFLLKKYHFSPLSVSLFMMVLGMGFALGFGYLVDFFAKRFLLRWVAVGTMVISCVASLLTVSIHSIILAWIAVFFMGAFISVAYTVMISIFSNQVAPTQQGWIMGITGAIMALSFGIIGLLSPVLTDFSANVPLIVSVVCLGLGAILKSFNPQT